MFGEMSADKNFLKSLCSWPSDLSSLYKWIECDGEDEELLRSAPRKGVGSRCEEGAGEKLP